jgi:hypothetical protein
MRRIEDANKFEIVLSIKALVARALADEAIEGEDYVAFLIRTNKQLRQKFDFRRASSPAFVLSNRDGLLRYINRAGLGADVHRKSIS